MLRHPISTRHIEGEPRGAVEPALPDGSTPPVSILEADPDLAAAVPERERGLARHAGLAPCVSLARGPYDFYPESQPGALGALLLTGLITVRVAVGELGHIELLTPGDVISPWVGYGGGLMAPARVSATVVAPAELGFLDRRFTERTARWPEIHAAIAHRLIERGRRLSFQAAVNAVPRTDDRLELTLWHVAERIARVTPAGVALTLPLTQAELGELIGARRPSVTTGIRRLVEDGRVIRTGRHSWLLPGAPPEALTRLRRAAGLLA